MTAYSDVAPVARTLDDYPLSLQSAARALWGDENFWGRDRPRVTPPQDSRRGRRSA